MDIQRRFLNLETLLNNALSEMSFQSSVFFVNHPLAYAMWPHREYIEKYLDGPKPYLFLGMNPGPDSSVQTGIPFGDVDTVKNWLNITSYGKQGYGYGLNAPPSPEWESGRRFHEVIKDMYHTPQAFFKFACVYNYCPIAFFDTNGINVTPTDYHERLKNLQMDGQRKIERLCNKTLGMIIHLLQVETIIALGQYSNNKAAEVCSNFEFDDIRIISVRHPSSRSRSYNDDWVEYAKTELGQILSYPHQIGRRMLL